MRDWGLSKAQDYSSTQLLTTVTAVRGALNKYHLLPVLVSQQLDVQALLVTNQFKDLVRVRRYLEQISVLAGAASVIILDKNAQVAAHSDWRGATKLSVENFIDNPVFINSIKGEQSSGVWFGEQRGVWFYFSAPIYHYQQLIGVAVVRIDVAKALENTVAREAFFLTDNNNALAYATPKTINGQPFDLSQLETFKLIDGTDLQMLPLGNTALLVQQVRLDDTQWNIGVITEPMVDKNARYSALAVFSLCILIILLMMYIREWRAKKRSQHQAVAAQIESEARGRNIINTTQSGLITLDSVGCITFINPLVMQQFGISLNSVVNQPLAMLFDRPASFTSLKRVLDNLAKLPNASFSPLTGYEVVAKRSDGSFFPALFSIKQMRSSPVTEYLVTLVDITKRKQLERSLKEINESLEDKVKQRTNDLESAQAELLKIEKMAALGAMSTAIVHEINQPLTALRNYLAIIDKVKEQPQLIIQPLESLNHLVDNMAGITRQLKTFAYAKVVPKDQVDLVSVLNGVSAILTPQLQQHNIKLIKQFGDQSVIVLADRLRLEQVLHNLISNAIDAMANQIDKNLTISLTGITLGNQVNGINLVISDTGSGISDEQLTHIFEPFFTTKEIGMGLGLGLSIVKNIVTDLNGTIEAQNVNQGVEFTIRLPIVSIG
jgi:PAS domain S-box-containing protein